MSLNLFGSISPNPCHLHHLSCQEPDLKVLTRASFFFLLSRSMSHQACISFSCPHLKPCVLKGLVGQHPPILAQSTFHTTATWPFLKHKHLHVSLFLKKWLVSCCLMSNLIGWQVQTLPTISLALLQHLQEHSSQSSFPSISILLIPTVALCNWCCPPWRCPPHVRNTLSYSSFRTQLKLHVLDALPHLMVNSPMARASALLPSQWNNFLVISWAYMSAS